VELQSIFSDLGIALGLGLLVGLQREHAESDLAGIRTFPLVTFLGTLTAMLAQSFGGWVLAASFVSLAMMIVIGDVAKLKARPADPGLTTEISILLMFSVGAYLVAGPEEIAIAIGGGVAVLLHFKGQLHGFTAKLGAEDLKAIMQFALLSLVILPVLPDETFGPYDVLNPRSIWWMVVLIVAISLVGYIAYKFIGKRAGAAFGGILGGIISSTATTVSYAKRTASAPEANRGATIAIMLASTVVYLRVLLLILLVAPTLFSEAALPLLTLFLIFAALSGFVWQGREEGDGLPPHHNPTELRSALLFGLVYGIVIFAVAATHDLVGEGGLYLVAGLSGLTKVDAITLSTSNLVVAGRVVADHAWRILMVALLSNIVFKTVIIAWLGDRGLLVRVSRLYAVALVGGILILIFWP
jgi:uncharacterized membrane protein (DUF4010 family)